MSYGTQSSARTSQVEAKHKTSKDAFDLARIKQVVARARQSDRMPNPQLPQGTDIRLVAFQAPEIDLRLVDGGPVMTMGALGSRYKNMPSLVHVGMAWDF
ncbi:hypothetical protein GRI58_07185 [Porphyrobacter algicida]|uniref:Uncharacterized protein n=2 Tax=Qipengyuania algicida TaxID=1836209 RepID=A0A845AHE9_9SPHN|nr:hypothetical protein [Qipengyuania algicida]